MEEKKVEYYQKTFAMLQNYPEIKDLKRPDKQKDFTLIGKIGVCDFYYELRAKADVLTLQATITCMDKSVEAMLSFGKDVVQDMDWITCTPYDGSMMFISKYLFNSVPDHIIDKEIMERTKKFVEMLINHADDIRSFLNNEYPEPEQEKAEMDDAMEAEEESSDINDEDSKDGEKAVFMAENLVEVEASKDEPVMDENIHEKFELEKEEFMTYCKDQKLILETEQNKIQGRKKALDKREKALDQRKKSIKKREDELSLQQEKLDKSLFELQEKQSAYEKERAEFEKEVEKQNQNSLDKRMLKRRKEYEQMESEFFSKKQEFQKFEEETLLALKQRIDESEQKEKEIEEKNHQIDTSREELKKEQTFLEVRIQEAEEKEKELIRLQMELSDREAEVVRAEILKKEAENDQKKLEIASANFEKKKERLAALERKLVAKEEESSVKEKIMAELQQKTADQQKDLESLNQIIHDNEIKMQEILDREKGLKADLEQSINEKDEITDQVKGLRSRLQKTEEKYQEILVECENYKKTNTGLKEEHSSMSEALSKLREEKEESELTLATIRGELFELKEAIKNKETNVKIQLNTEEEDTLREQIRELQEELQEVRKDNDALIKMSHEKDHSANNEDVFWELVDGMISGISFLPVIGESDSIYHANIEGMRVYVDLKNHIIQAEKEPKKMRKIYKKISDMNTRNLAMTFYSNGKEVIARKFGGHSVGEALEEMIQNMNEI